MKDNSTGKDKEFYELGKKMFDRLNPPLVQREWVETNNSACKILRQVHDMLALASVPNIKTWVGLTELEKAEITSLKWWDWEDTFDIEGFIRAIETKLKEKNNE